MSHHDIDTASLLRAIATLPETFATKDVSEHQVVREANRALLHHRNFHAFVGKALAQLPQLDRAGDSGSRGALWHRRTSARVGAGPVVTPPAGALGPQSPSDNELTRRLRRHQSWYRAAVLGLPCGTGPKPSSATAYGNMLRREDGAAGRNFLSGRIFQVAMRRLKEPGAVEPFRLLHNMLSSQPMCFNLFGELVDNLPLATRLAQALWGERVAAVTRVQMEHAPQPAEDFLDDRTAFDAFIEYRTPEGGLGFVGVETKLSEPFSAKHYDKPAYRRWMGPGSPWRPDAGDRVDAVAHNQLWRDHLLAWALLCREGSQYSEGRLLVAYHPQDRGCAGVIEGYRGLLADEATFEARTLAEIVEVWREVAGGEGWLEDFSARYLELEGSEGGPEARS